MKLILPKHQVVTRNVELVEADNIRRSINRIRKSCFNSTPASRAIIQAMLMTGDWNREQMSGVRSALGVS